MSKVKFRASKLVVFFVVLASIISSLFPHGNTLTVSASSLTNQQITDMLTKIKNEFPQGSIWDERSKRAYGGKQCYEFARYLAARIFNGQYPTNGHKPETPISNGEVRNGFKAFLLKDDGQYTGTNVVVEPGDVISVYGQQHHAIVWKVEGGKIYVAEAWGSESNKINWGFFNGSESTIEQIKSRSDYTAVCVWKHPGGSNSAPVVTSQMSISGQTQPTGSLKIGSYFDIRGIISSTFPISQVTAGVYNANGSATAQVKTVSPNTTSYNLVNIDSYIKFNLLSAGSYVYKVVATDTNGKSFTLVNSSFSITAPASQMSISGQTQPTGTLKLGSYFDLRGVISSTFPISQVTAGVYYTNGSATAQVKTVNPNTTSYNLVNIDSYIKFNLLSAGSYVYKVVATDTNGKSFTLVNSSFSITAPASQMSISGQTQPTGTLKLGSYFDIRGIISSTFPISQVTAGVYNANGSATAQVKTVSPNTTSYNLVNIDSYIKFNLLSAGSYVYKVIATDTNGKSFTLVSSNFSVAAPAATYSISGNKYPSGNLTYGKGFGIYGTITSNLPLNTVTVGVYYTNGTATKQVRTISTSSTSCNIGTYFDPYIIFNNLSRGSYVYKITVNSKVIFTSYFNIV